MSILKIKGKVITIKELYMNLLKLADIFFEILHLSLIGFNLMGWLFKSTRRANLYTLGATFLSWFGLGLFYGIGYCPLTDWHWQIKSKLGITNLPNSYITYFLENWLGLHIQPQIVDIATFAFFFFSLCVSVYLNIIRKK